MDRKTIEQQSIEHIESFVDSLPPDGMAVVHHYIASIDDDVITGRMAKYRVIYRILGFEMFLRENNLMVHRRAIILYLKRKQKIRFDWSVNTIEQYCSILAPFEPEQLLTSDHIGVSHYQAVARANLTIKNKLQLLTEYHDACVRGFYHDTDNVQSIIEPDLDELRRRAKAMNDSVKGSPTPPTETPKLKHENFTIENVEPAKLKHGLELLGYQTTDQIFDNKQATVYIRVVYKD